jgi:hypothetical protein
MQNIRIFPIPKLLYITTITVPILIEIEGGKLAAD